MQRRTFLSSALACLLLFPLSVRTARAEQAGAFPLNITDASGKRHEFGVPPQRVAAVSYCAVDLALALGILPVATTYMTKGRAPDYLLGLTSRMTDIGQRASPNLEVLSSVQPDVIVAMRRYTEAHAAQYEKIAPYLAWNMELLNESYHEVAQLAALLGKAERGQQLNQQFKHRLAELSYQAPRSNKGPSFQIMWAGESPFSFHDEATPASIVKALGGNNIMGPEPRNGRFGAEISLEAMLEKDPDVIFVYDSGPNRPHENNPVWSMLSAVKHQRVHYVGDAWVETNGPIAREVVLKQAAHYLYPDHFAPADVAAIARSLIPRQLLG